MQEYDITYGDFNPTILYAGKHRAVKNGVYHFHEYMEMTCVLSGECEYLIEGETHTLHEGDILIAGSGVKHQYRLTNPENPPMEFYLGFFGFHFKDMEKNEIRLKNGGYIMHCKGELRQEVTKLCYSMDAESKDNKMGKHFMMKAYLMQMLLLIVRDNVETDNEIQNGYVFKSSNKSYVVKKIITYLNENYNKKISLEQIAQNMYLSPVYISKLFKEETGESPINYLIKIRLEKAKELLKKPDSGSIKNIARHVGYDDVYYFSKLFKKYYGKAPLYFRKDEK